MNFIDKPIEPQFKEAKIIEAVCPVGTHPGLVLSDGTLTLERGHHAGFVFTTTIKNEGVPANSKDGYVESCYPDHGSD